VKSKQTFFFDENCNNYCSVTTSVDRCEQVPLEQQVLQEAEEKMDSRDLREPQEQLALLVLEVTLDHPERQESVVSKAVQEVLARKALLDSPVVQELLALQEKLVQLEFLDLLVVVEIPDQMDHKGVQVYQARLAGEEIRGQ